MNKKFKQNKFSFDKAILNSKFDFCKNLKWFMIAPLLIILVGVILFSTIGFRLGLDFTGGTVLKVFLNEKGEISELDKYSYDDMYSKINGVLNKHSLKIDEDRSTTIKFNGIEGKAIEVQYQNLKNATGQEITETNNEITAELQELLGYKKVDIEHDYTGAISSPEVVTAVASSELLMNAFIAMLVAIALILVYVAFRFELTSGLAAVLALFHDLLIMTSCVLIFRITINSSFVAALVTILGYSINNTIIIFDRIRENTRSGKYEKAPNSVVANESVKQTMTRSIFTTITTLITISMVAIIGVSDIREFALPILIGIIAGFYSSVFLTPGLWAVAYRPRKKRKNKAIKV